MAHISGTDFTYSEVGETRSATLPYGYHQLEMRRVLGVGRELFDATAERVMTWQMHRRAGLSIADDTPRAAPGILVTSRIGLRAKGFGVDAPCEVVYVVDEQGAASSRRGFAYGTLAGHPETGEESFIVELGADGVVSVVIRAFSRPGVWWSAALGPIGRLGQRLVTRRYLAAAAP